jgi:hypothetical protein
LKRAWVLAALLAGCTQAPQQTSDWEKQNAQRLGGPEEVVALPPFPSKGNLVEVYVSAVADFKYFVDEKTLTVNPKERVIRYVLVAQSPSGVQNVRYEAIRCPDEYRVLALGRPDGTWGGQPSEWRPIVRAANLSWPYALSRRYFGPHRDPVRTVAEASDALERGVHPAVEVQRSMGGSGE